MNTEVHSVALHIEKDNLLSFAIFNDTKLHSSLRAYTCTFITVTEVQKLIHCIYIPEKVI